MFKAFATLLAVVCFQVWAIPPTQKTLPKGLAPFEKPVRIDSRAVTGDAPNGPIRAFAEWEASDAVMIQWDNPDLIRKLAKNGKVKLLADTNSDVDWWKRFLRQNNIPETNISYFIQPTNTIWVRDYGPWYAVDGNNKVSIVDTIYNRPRPQDDKFPEFVGNSLGLNVYQPKIVHTGGNYYTDGLGKAFSSTLVKTENPNLQVSTIFSLMQNFLGISDYFTTPLGERITIEHIDTYGKLVSEDTWVIAQFPEGAPYYDDVEAMVAKLENMKSSLGTAYKIYRLPVRKTSSGWDRDYKAYINSLISNNTVYVASYGDSDDQIAKQVYEQAMPGYKVELVNNYGTYWGDSVHCRTRNLHTVNRIFAKPVQLPSESSSTLKIEVINTSESDLIGLRIFVQEDENEPRRIASLQGDNLLGPGEDQVFTFDLAHQAQTTLRFYLETETSTELLRFPSTAPLNQFEIDL